MMILEDIRVLGDRGPIDCVLADLDSSEVKEKVVCWCLQDFEGDIKAA